MKSKQEMQINAELAQMGVKAHITHLKHPEGSYYRVVTVATPKAEAYPHLAARLAGCYLEAHTTKRFDLARLIIDRFAEFGAGVALCHHLDNFNRERGRIISEGRMLKLSRAQS